MGGPGMDGRYRERIAVITRHPGCDPGMDGHDRE